MARLFSAASSQYLINNDTVKNADPMTMSCWFYTGATNVQRGLVSLCRNGSGDGRFTLFADDDGTICLAARTTSTAIVNTSTTYSANTWHHACGTATNDTRRDVYLDGGGQGTTTQSKNITSQDATVIGAFHESSGFMDGRIAEVGIWAVALSAGEVAALAGGACPLRIRPQSLVLYCPLYGVADPEPNYSKTGLHMSLVNAPTRADHAPVTPPNFGFDYDWQGITGGTAPPPATSWGRRMGQELFRRVRAA